MISRLLGGAMPWLLAALLGLLVFQYQLLQSSDAERDTALLQAEHAQERAEILQEHQQWQRQQIQTLNTALSERDETLTTIANDIRASNAALEQLGEQDAEIRTWLDRDVPSGIDSWVRDLQQSTIGDAVRLPRGTGSPD
ncbi:hypothetical protein [Vreelandella profundi]|uniref:hypothetical protein n=1 Tax=Vreelandella profundi TaxID=2852117 RepID=UPI001F255475|nr:hypothetical protein [Halomonas profundi]